MNCYKTLINYDNVLISCDVGEIWIFCHGEIIGPVENIQT